MLTCEKVNFERRHQKWERKCSFPEKRCQGFPKFPFRKFSLGKLKRFLTTKDTDLLELRRLSARNNEPLYIYSFRYYMYPLCIVSVESKYLNSVVEVVHRLAHPDWAITIYSSLDQQIRSARSYDQLSINY